MNSVVRKRGRPPKALQDTLRDQAGSDLASCQDVWVRVEIAKLQRPDLSLESICKVLVTQAERAKERAPKRIKEVLASQKYLFKRNTLRRLYYRADALVQNDPRLAEYLAAEVKHRVERIK